jgi:hypothetical protein
MAVAGLASGKLDALLTMIGIGAGSLLLAAYFPALEGFSLSSDRGTETLQTFFWSESLDCANRSGCTCRGDVLVLRPVQEAG